MCGISGVFLLSSNQMPLKDLVSKMNSRYAHLGQDDKGIRLADLNLLSFGQSRLIIIDLYSVDHQPIYDTSLVKLN